MPLTLRWSGATTLPVDGSAILPETFRELDRDSAARFRLRLGNSTCELGELFQVQGDRGGEVLTVEGDLRHLDGLGRRMGGGTLVVCGDTGPRLGAEMTDGTITVEGSAGDWAGAELGGGKIRIRGNSGHYLGAAYPGSRRGMRAGAILVDGAVGDDAGLLMRRGLIAIRGEVGGGLGRSMIAGTILALGRVGRRLGAGMKRGTMVLPSEPGGQEDSILPSFADAGAFAMPFLAIVWKQLAAWDFGVPEAVTSLKLHRYNGDLAVGGQGEILVGRGGA